MKEAAERMKLTSIHVLATKSESGALMRPPRSKRIILPRAMQQNAARQGDQEAFLGVGKEKEEEAEEEEWKEDGEEEEGGGF
jgi:hypothetical protein